MTALSPAAPGWRRYVVSPSLAFDTLCLVVVAVFALLWVLPTAFAIRTSLVENTTAAKGAAAIAGSGDLTLHSYLALFAQGDILDWYLSSAITSILTVVLTLVTASMAAFALSRLRFRGKRAVFLVVLAGIVIPGQVLIVPWFREFDALGLLNTWWAVSLPQIPTAIAVFIFKQFFDGLPKEIEEVARVDGASFWRVYRRIIMPLARPAVAAVAIFTFVQSWNDLLWPLLVLSNPEIMTVPVGLATVQGSFGIRYADVMASAILGAIPLVAVFLLFQRRIVEGIAGTGLKG